MLSQAFYVVRILSPALAEVLVDWAGQTLCFWLDAGSLLFSAALISTTLIERPLTQQGSVKALTHDFAEGNRFIFTHRALTFAFLASAAAMFMLSSFSPLISIYIRDTLHAGTLLYGGISSMVGVGLIFGTQLLAKAGKERPMASVILVRLFALGGAAALLGAFENVGTAALSTFTIGAAIAFVIVPAQTLSQRTTPHAMQGRVSSTFMSLFSLAQVLGLLLSGVLAARLGIRQLFLACAAATALLAVASSLFLRPRPQPQVSGPSP